MTYELSVVVPVYNERENLEKLADSVATTMAKMKPGPWEMIFVDDGSRDGSAELLEKMMWDRPYLRVLRFPANQGQTAAIDAGIRAARGVFVATMDGDLQNDPADLPLLQERMVADVGAVVGVRLNRKDNWLRLVSSRVANGVRNWLSNETIADTGCGLKLFRRACFDRLTLYEGMHRFLPTLVKMEGYRVVEVPVSHHPRLAGKSKYGVWNRALKGFLDLLAVRWMKRRWLRYQFIELHVDHK